MILRSLSLLIILSIAGPVSAARVWFVDNARPNGNGSAASPFATLGAAEAVSAAGDVMFVFAGKEPYRGGIVLKPQQTLIGEAGPLAPVLARAAITGITPPPIGSRPVIEGSVVCGGSAAIDGVAVRATENGGVIGGGGSLELDDVTIEVTGAGDGILLRNHGGTLAVRRGAIRGAGSGAAIRIEGGSGDVTIEGMPIERTGGAALIVRKRGGAISFRSGSPITVSGGQADAILIEESTATIKFADPLTIVTTGARALVANQAALLSIAGGSFESTDAAAVELRSVVLDVTLGRVAASGNLDTGVILEKTTGRFHVAGGAIKEAKRHGIELRGAVNVSVKDVVLTGTATTNGVAAGECAADLVTKDNLRCHAAIAMHDVENLSFENVRIEGSAQIGISGSHVRNATFKTVSVTAAGDEHQEHAVVFRNLLGDVRFIGCTISRPASRAVYIVNDTGVAKITFEACRITDVMKPHGMQAILINAHGDAEMTVTARNNVFERIFSSALFVAAEGKSKATVTVSGNTFKDTGGAVNLIADRAGRMTFDVSKNQATGSTVVPFNVHVGANSVSASMSGVIAANRIADTKCRSCTGISVKGSGTSVVAANIAGNEIAGIDGTGIWVQADRRSRVHVAMTANTLRSPASAEYAAIRVQAGSQSGDTSNVCARIGGGTTALANRISGAWDPRGAIQLVNRSASTLTLPGLAASDTESVASHLRSRNGGAGTRLMLATEPRAGAIAGGGECSVPEIR